jgi:hypothetical protein
MSSIHSFSNIGELGTIIRIGFMNNTLYLEVSEIEPS